MQRKSLYLTAPNTLQWVEEDLPELGWNEVLVKTVASAISIGSELPQYTGTARHNQPITYPRMTGYENIGEIVALGKYVKDVEVGQRVVGWYGYRTNAILSSGEMSIITIPDDISIKAALLTILSCDVAKGIRKLNINPEDRILVTGAGTIGLLTVAMLRAYGYMYVDVIEPDEIRRNLALELGANAVFSDFPKAPIYRYGFECSSRNEAFHTLQMYMGKFGKIVILSDGNIEPLTLSPYFHSNELQIVASSDGWSYYLHAQWYFDYLRHTNIPLEKIFDLEITASQIPQTFANLASGDQKAIKVFITDFEI